jgi:hypothetical protein
MLTVRVRIYPSLDKVADVRTFMTQWIKAAQGQGEQVALTQRIYTSEGPMLMVPRRYDDMAALDARRLENLADSAWQERLAKLGTMISQPVRQAIEDTVVPPVASDTPVGIVRRAFFHPVMDKVGQFRSTLAEAVQKRQAAGQGQIALMQQIFSDAGPTLIITTTHANLTELDRDRRERASDVDAILASVAGMSRAPVVVRLLEVLVPFPS